MASNMAKRRVAPLAVLLLFALTCRVWPQAAQRPLRLKASPGLTVTDAGGWKTVFQGAEYRRISLERLDPYQSIQLKVLRFDSRWIEPRVVHSAEYRLRSATVKTLAEKSGALAIINANYFDERHAALGFFKAGSERNLAISKSPLFTGIFAIKDRAALIMHRDQFDPEQADEGLQAGPLLLAKGSPLAVTDNLFGGLTWTELQELFGAPEWRIETPDLMNLDGGGSTQLSIRTAGYEEHISGTAEVPVAIGFFPKSR